MVVKKFCDNYICLNLIVEYLIIDIATFRNSFSYLITVKQ
jgi:hypothetical protein